MDRLEDHLKTEEGFSGMPYEDHLGYPTIGYGTKLPIKEDEADLLLRHRLQKKRDEIVSEKPVVLELPKPVQEVIFAMCYQLGVRGTLLFKRMWSALERGDFAGAADEILDSKFATQTPGRAKRLAKIVMGAK